MGGNIVSTSYKTGNTTDLEVAKPEDYSTFQDEKSQYASPNSTTMNSTPDTSIPLEGGGDDTLADGEEEESAPWHGLPMGVDEHGSFAVINTDVPMNHVQMSYPEDREPQCCLGLRDRCKMACRPCLAKHNQLPPDPSHRARLKFAVLCPPHGLVAKVVLNVTIVVLLWAVLWSITGAEALPGGNLFAIYVLVVVAALGGKLIELVHLPALLGMLLVGFMFKNVPGIQIADDIHPGWASALRNIALVVILVKAGLGIDAAALRRLSVVCARLATVPCVSEAVTVALVSRGLLGFGWDWAFMLGFVIAAVSPAVVVPSVLELQEKGYGIRRGVPTLIVASASCENVFAIAAFGVALGIAFSSDNTGVSDQQMNTSYSNITEQPFLSTSDSSSDDVGDLVFDIFRAPIELLMGVAFGCVGGIFLWYIPNKNQKSLTWKRALLVCGGGLFSVFGFAQAGFTGAGAMGCLILPFVAAQGWGRAKEPVNKIVGIIWTLFEPILFGIIGAAVSVEYLDGNTVGFGIAIMVIGLIVRTIVTYLMVCKAGLDLKSKVFAALAWLPKATVQAAIGPLALEVAKDKNAGPIAEQNGIKVLTLAVLSIILTAPIGAILIALGGPRLLEKSLTRDDIRGQRIPKVKVLAPEGEESRGIQEGEAKEEPRDGPAETSSML
ncbi:sodium/hydrogen exchanger 9B2-like [Acanthaster planci]|uniref:Sodium/hydrogen exchanger 9B2-like n=1 Tax=Acanthaster planci TaxID=133434 RepID=A0A8B8A455_ACAPL|nr:sodium/hydrogen exchanger 9B2-like [Acanthaster planci]XP_022110697.1 sodium/hydrogen exchanger 9B2-like [Acanthaster planci]XP_022110698.1 sodium/hydrogen exchanger 9B2-like [Acanthaster planci]XP_022110699.1 sodium/hydrogen exchanger 9B2-like [Acanthaster planci]